MVESARPNLERLRLEPLNRVAAIKLKEAGIDVHNAVLPVFRLMEWGLTIGVNGIGGRQKTARELIYLRQMNDQEKAVEYLLDNLPGGRTELQKRLLQLSPLDAARELVDILDMRLKSDPGKSYPEF